MVESTLEKHQHEGGEAIQFISWNETLQSKSLIFLLIIYSLRSKTRSNRVFKDRSETYFYHQYCWEGAGRKELFLEQALQSN